MLFVTFIAFGLVFLLLDILWLKSIGNFYKKQLGSLLLKKPNMKAAILFYVFYVTLITLLVVYPAVSNGNGLLGYVALNAALLGLLAYATYDLTNMATLKNWSWKLVAIDIMWGMAATAGAASAAYVVVTGIL
jgi:uncharacterized membrane protein